MKFDFDKNKKIIIIALVLLFIVFLFIRVIIVSLSSDDNNNEENSRKISQTSEDSKNEKDEEKIKKLKNASEAERIRIYLGEYFKFLEKKDYESAYNLLYSDFKQNYFPTFEKYKEYIEKCKYPDMLAITYKNIQVQGNYYIVTLDIKNLDPDAINSEMVVKEDTKFVVKENDYDEFYLSFQL